MYIHISNKRRIFGQPCTLDEILDPEEECEIGKNIYAFNGGDAEIVGTVQKEMRLVRDDSEESDSDDDPEVVPLPLKEIIKMYRTIKENSMVVCTEGALELVKALRQYQAHLQRREKSRQRWMTSFICSRFLVNLESFIS